LIFYALLKQGGIGQIKATIGIEVVAEGRGNAVGNQGVKVLLVIKFGIEEVVVEVAHFGSALADAPAISSGVPERRAIAIERWLAVSWPSQTKLTGGGISVRFDAGIGSVVVIGGFLSACGVGFPEVINLRDKGIWPQREVGNVHPLTGDIGVVQVVAGGCNAHIGAIVFGANATGAGGILNAKTRFFAYRNFVAVGLK
jgi:hypothetical protein